MKQAKGCASVIHQLYWISFSIVLKEVNAPVRLRVCTSALGKRGHCTFIGVSFLDPAQAVRKKGVGAFYRQQRKSAPQTESAVVLTPSLFPHLMQRSTTLRRSNNAHLFVLHPVCFWAPASGAIRRCVRENRQWIRQSSEWDYTTMTRKFR